MNRSFIAKLALIALPMLLFPGLAKAESVADDYGKNYCFAPAFISQTLQPNLLLMIDNSASMFDLRYIAGSTSAAPTTSCSTGSGTASATSTYCFDNTFNASYPYEGYFSKYDANYDPSYPFYQYVPDAGGAATGKFEEVAALPTDTGAGIYRTDYLYIKMSGSGTAPSSRKVETIVAKGNFLNWLTASKFDVEKKILTGGKYSSGALQAESRGCVGRRFVKVLPDLPALSFAVRGPTSVEATYDPSTQGGGTRIEIFEGTYDASACTCAVYNWSYGRYGQASTDTKDCLGASPADNALASLNHAQQTCYAIRDNWKNGRDLWQGVNIQDIKTACTNVYQDNKNPMPPSSIVDEASGNYICTSAAVHLPAVAPYNGFGSDIAGFVGKCWKDATDKFTGNDDCVRREILHYCMGTLYSDVTDPSGDVGDKGNIPAVIMDAGVKAIGAPVGPTGSSGRCSLKISPTQSCAADSDCSKVCSNDYTKTCTASTDCSSPGVCISQSCGNPFYANIKVASPPTGLINDFAKTIRFGAMTFNQYGAGTECGTVTGVPCVAHCSLKPTKMCTLGGSDCVSGEGTCTKDKNLDGGKIGPFIGTTFGDHGTAGSVVKSIDDFVASSWTPFAEAYYNAIAYFVKDAVATTPTLNAAKFTPTGAAISAPLTKDTDVTDSYTNKNPIQFRCQKNNILLITDGGSTADLNDNMKTKLTALGIDLALEPATCGSYKGSPYLQDLSKLANKKNIFDPTQDCSTAGACENAQTIKTHVIFTGKTSASSDLCDAYYQMSKTAENGGTTIRVAENPKLLRQELKAALESIAAGASSGTAASILSNSEGSGANILQAVFYPKKVFEEQTEAKWIGEMQNLWYFVDPLINRSTIREDSDQNKAFNLISDNVVSFRFDPTDNNTYGYVSQDTNGDGAGDTVEVKKDSDKVLSVWRAGRQLALRNLADNTKYRNIKTTLDGSTLFQFSSSTFGTDNANALAPFLNIDSGEAKKLIDYVHGIEQTGYRPRAVTVKVPYLNPDLTVGYENKSAVWRLGDIISSTPRIQSTGKLNTYNLPAPSGYSDPSYASFIASTEYTKKRGMVYVGANDGMMHAFNFGLLKVNASGYEKATLEKVDSSDPDLGEEMWAYIPKHALPYLRYYANPDYSHLYYVDGSSLLFDASIGVPTGATECSAATYWNCVKKPVVTDSGNNLSDSLNPWRSILIGGMGLGGATSRDCDGTTQDCVQTPRHDPADDAKGFGYSSYFALDVTNPKTPKLLWEYNHPDMGFATTGAAIVRVGDPTKNGRWFAVFGSGPTGPIDTSTKQFMGRSNQTLKFFVVDLATGKLATTEPIDTKIPGAFAGSMIGASIDADRWNPSAAGNYQDDAILVGYTKKVAGTPDTWTDGGVIRIVTKQSTNPNDWVWSKVVEGTGPVVNAVARLQDRKNKNLWYYFGTGRFYYRSGADIDDYKSRRAIYGIKDPCYNTAAKPGNMYDKDCGTTVTTGITNQSDSVTEVGSGGWKIDLDEYTTAFGAERVVTDAVALTNGTVFLTSFEPTSDACGFGGNSFLWGLGYDTGDRPSNAALQGKALIQLSTGEFKEVNLAEAFGAGSARLNRRTSVPMTGKPPADAFPIVSKSGNKPVKRIMHIQER